MPLPLLLLQIFLGAPDALEELDEELCLLPAAREIPFLDDDGGDGGDAAGADVGLEGVDRAAPPASASAPVILALALRLAATTTGLAKPEPSIIIVWAFATTKAITLALAYTSYLVVPPLAFPYTLSLRIIARISPLLPTYPTPDTVTTISISTAVMILVVVKARSHLCNRISHDGSADLRKGRAVRKIPVFLEVGPENGMREAELQGWAPGLWLRRYGGVGVGSRGIVVTGRGSGGWRSLVEPRCLWWRSKRVRGRNGRKTIAMRSRIRRARPHSSSRSGSRACAR